jgi:hypothetical protein
MALRGRRGEVLHIRNMNSVVFCLDALARNSNGRRGGALGTGTGAASLRAATYRTDATGERALKFRCCRRFPRMPAGFRVSSIERRSGRTIQCSQRARRAAARRPRPARP